MGSIAPMLLCRPVFRARWTALCSTCGQPDHGAKHAWPANEKNRSNGSIVSSFGISPSTAAGRSLPVIRVAQVDSLLMCYPTARRSARRTSTFPKPDLKRSQWRPYGVIFATATVRKYFRPVLVKSRVAVPPNNTGTALVRSCVPNPPLSSDPDATGVPPSSSQ